MGCGVPNLPATSYAPNTALWLRSMLLIYGSSCKYVWAEPAVRGACQRCTLVAAAYATRRHGWVASSRALHASVTHAHTSSASAGPTLIAKRAACFQPSDQLVSLQVPNPRACPRLSNLSCRGWRDERDGRSREEGKEAGPHPPRHHIERGLLEWHLTHLAHPISSARTSGAATKVHRAAATTCAAHAVELVHADEDHGGCSTHQNQHQRAWRAARGT